MKFENDKMLTLETYAWELIKLVSKTSVNFYDKVAINLEGEYSAYDCLVLDAYEVSFEKAKEIIKNFYGKLTYRNIVKKIEVLNIHNKKYYQDDRKIYIPSFEDFIRDEIKKEGKYVLIIDDWYEPEFFELDVLRDNKKMGYPLNTLELLKSFNIKKMELESMTIHKIPKEKSFKISYNDRFPEDPGCGIISIDIDIF